jgi:hypothetical protein
MISGTSVRAFIPKSIMGEQNRTNPWPGSLFLPDAACAIALLEQ